VKAVDTNVLARFFVDDPDDEEALAQRPAAVAVMSDRVFVGLTVLLEFEWVLRGFYGFGRGDVSRVMRALCELPTALVEDREAVLAAIESHARGVDFADALHLARASRCEALATFDKRLAKRATVLGLLPKCELPAV
jgi:predicted nucleic-acid-binding protein